MAGAESAENLKALHEHEETLRAESLASANVTMAKKLYKRR